MTRVMRTTRTLMSAAVLVALAACQPQDGEMADGQAADDGDAAAAVDTAAIEAGLDSLRSAYVRAVDEEDWETLGTLTTEDAVLVSPGGADRDSLREAAGDAPFPPGASLEIEPWETRVLSPDWAYEIGTGTITWTPEGADEPRTLRDTYLVLLQRTDDGWKLHREVASSRPLSEREGSGDGG